MVRNTLDTYRRKRDFGITPEPPGKLEKGPGGRFVVHEHHASSLHFDLRLEMGGVLKSFAVPKGPSLDPSVRRLAINTEDHPVKYLAFQGSISDGQYGAGQMVIWDAGTYTVRTGENPLRQYEQGKLHLEFHGERLRGGFMLIRGREDRQWILFKKRDDAAEAGWETPMILPYGARTEKPAGFGIPAEALRKLPQGKADWSAAGQAENPDSHAHFEDAPGVKASGKPAKKAVKATARKKTETTKGRSAKAAQGQAPMGARRAPMPVALEPMLATLADKPFADPLWLFETKWDGWRALLRKDAEGMRLVSRSGKDLDAMFPELSAVHAGIAADECILDGEIVALDDRGLPRFQLLQNRLKGKRAKGRNGSAYAESEGVIVFYAFDMPYWEGLDLTACPLVERKALLERILPKPSPKTGLGKSGSGKAGKAGTASGGPLRFSPGFEGDGIAIFNEAVKLGFEGVVAKLKSSPYRRGRSADWLKVKGKMRQEVVVCGYTRPRGARDHFGSLVAGLYKDGKLVFAGHVGGGFNAKLLKQVHGFMAPLKIKECPFAVVPKTNEKVQWIRPRLVAEAEFAEWTRDGLMRQPIFLGLREDKDPKACVREVVQPVERLVEKAESESTEASASESAQVPDGPVFTHTEKLYWPKDGYTKGDLIAYYRAVAPHLLPHLKDRPLILKRYPNGIDAPPFYQHDVKTAPAFVSTVAVEEPAGTVNYALCQNEASLLWLANMGVIPQNPWLSRVPHLGRPDWIVFDLDPQEVAFPDVCKMALYLKEILDELGLKAYPKTSGSRGVHVYAPLKPAYDFEQSLDFAQLVAALAVKRKPDVFTVERSLKVRKRDRIYLDCLQNSMGKSVASVYSVREKPGATVSAAVDWAELKRGVRMEDFDIRTMPKRLEKKGDLFADVLKVKNGLEGAFKKLQKLL